MPSMRASNTNTNARLLALFELVLLIAVVNWVPAVDARKVAPFAVTTYHGVDTEKSEAVEVLSADAVRFHAWMKEHGKVYENEAEECNQLHINTLKFSDAKEV